MKKLREKLILFLLAAVMIPWSHAAAAVGAPVLRAGQVQALPGETVELPVTLDTALDLACFWIEITADAEIFSVPDGEPVLRGDFSDQGTMMCNALEEGRWKVIWYNDTDVSCSGELFRLRLNISPEAAAGDHPVRISCYSENTHNLAGVSPEIACSAGNVHVEGVPLGQAAMQIREISPVGPGGYADVTVELTQNPGLAAFQLYLEGDTACFSVEPRSDGGGLQITGGEILDKLPVCNLHGSTGWQIYWYSTTNLKDTGTLFTLRLKVSPEAAAGDYPLSLTAVDANTVDESGKPVTVRTSGAVVPVRTATLENSSVEKTGRGAVANICLERLSREKTADVIVAAYDKNGKMLQAARREISGTSSGREEVLLSAADPQGYVKFFALEHGNSQPLCQAREIQLG